MRVLHAPSEIAGQPSILARALRDLGVEAWSLATNPTFAQYRPDEHPPLDTLTPIPRYLGYAGLVARHLGRHDVFHFHFGRTLIPPHNWDLPLHRGLGKKVLFHYHGCDVRNRAHMLATHTHSTCSECDPFCIPSRQKRILASAASFADAEVVSTPDLLESATRASHLPVAIDLADYPCAPPMREPRLVVHAPTNRLIKGTRYVEQAFAELQPRFPNVRFEVVERVPFSALRDLLAQADVVVDQVFMGWYGMVAVEAMALGKPTLCFIRDDFEARLTDCPIVRCTKESLAERLAAVLNDSGTRRALGERGRVYVEREHAAPVIAARLVELYRSLIGVAEPTHG